MNLWALFLVMGAVTLLERISFIILLEKWKMPDLLERGLKYVPVTVMLALVAPTILRTDGTIDLSLLNPKVFAGAVAVIVAWRTRNVFLTIIIGMIALWLSTFLFA